MGAVATAFAVGLCLPGAAGAAAQARVARPVQNKVTIEANPQLFATLCALRAAGFEKDASLADWNPVRARLRSELMRLQGPATEALRAYYSAHLQADPAATLSRYVSFALVAGPPPDFKFVLPHDDLPPDVLTIEDFPEVLANFYREAQLERLWAQVQPEYNREIAGLHHSVTQLVATSNGYLRELLSSRSTRTFAVYVDPLVGTRTNFRNYGDHYVIVVGPGRELPLDEIRHAYLHFLLDPFPVRYARLVAAKRPLLEIAARAPRLPGEHKDDFTVFFGECLVRAVELRQRRLPPERLAAAIDDAESEGYVLVRALSRELAKFEKAEPAMSFYFPDMVRGISVAEESKRLQGVRFAPAEAQGTAASILRLAGGPGDPDVAAWLDEGDRQIAAKNAPAAAAAFERVLTKDPNHPRAVYGLAVASVLQGDSEKAKELFRRLVVKPSGGDAAALGRDPVIVAWSHVYLGRIYDVDGNRELAMSEYRAALAVDGAPETARLAAQRGIEKGYQPASRP